jgi:hypothetical protein
MHRKALLLIALTTMLSVLAVSCCNEERIWTGEVNVLLVPNSINMTTAETVVDTIRGPFRFEANLEFRLAQNFPLDVFTPTQLMALSCDETYNTRIESGSQRVSIDRPVLLDGTPLPLSTDFIGLLEEGSSEFSATGTDGHGVFLDFSEDVLQRLTFSEGTHTFTYTATTEGGEVISKAVTTYLQL